MHSITKLLALRINADFGDNVCALNISKPRRFFLHNLDNDVPIIPHAIDAKLRAARARDPHAVRRVLTVRVSISVPYRRPCASSTLCD